MEILTAIFALYAALSPIWIGMAYWHGRRTELRNITEAINDYPHE